jgi:putative toxin-antitoxin system antitoxin component (TIGR02293 family)
MTPILVEPIGTVPPRDPSHASALEWIQALEDGLPTEAVETAIERGVLTAEEADRLIVPRWIRCSPRRKLRRLTPDESDRLSRITRLTVRASDVVGTWEGGVRWLRDPSPSLGGRPPLDLLRTGEGAAVVEQLLDRLERWGY